MKTLSNKKTLDNYLSDSEHCPYCNSHRIEGDTLQSGAKVIWQNISCLDCKRTWQDIYTLTDAEDTEQ